MVDNFELGIEQNLSDYNKKGPMKMASVTLGILGFKEALN